MSCQKEELLPIEPAAAVVAQSPPCYTSTDLNSFLTQYGTHAADIVPLVPSDYFQDANCGVAKWKADVRILDTSGTLIATDLQPISINWTLDDDIPIVTEDWTLPFYTYVNEEINTDCPGIFQPTCNGFHELQITMEFADGTIYSRNGTAYGQVNNAPVSLCELGSESYEASDLNIFDFDCLCPIEFESYEFLVQGLEWDLNNDGSVNVSDLNIFLAGFGDC